LWRNRDRLAASNVEVLLVAFEPEERVRFFLEDVDFAWPVIVDESRDLYRAYGLERGGWRQVWLSRRTLGHYAGAFVRGRIPRRPTGDTLQLGGDFLIDGEGIVRFAHSSVEPADRPSVSEIRAAIARLCG
jgi:hypothetical protein